MPLMKLVRDLWRYFRGFGDREETLVVEGAFASSRVSVD